MENLLFKDRTPNSLVKIIDFGLAAIKGGKVGPGSVSSGGSGEGGSERGSLNSDSS